MAPGYPNLVITFLPCFEGSILLVLRTGKEENFPNSWAFPGGKVEIGETMIDALKREIREETGLEHDGKFAFLDSFYFKKSVGVAVLVRVDSNDVRTEEFTEFRWIASLAELQQFPRIAGIDNHFVSAQAALRNGYWLDMEEVNLRPERYLNDAKSSEYE